MSTAQLKVFFALFLTYAFFTNPYFTTNDASHFALTVAIVKEHSLTINNTLPQIISKGWKIKDFARFDDKIYSDKAPLGSFIAAPVYFVISKFTGNLRITAFLVSLFTSGILTALTGVLLFRIGGFFTESDLLKTAVSLGYGLGSMALFYGTVFFSHALTAFLCTTSFYFLCRIRNGDKSTANYALGGACSALALTSDYIAAVSSICLLIYGVERHKKYLITIIAFIAALLPLLVYHYLLFGSPFTTPYRYGYLYTTLHEKGVYGIGAPSWSQLAKMLFSKWGFLFCNFPVVLSGILAVRFFKHLREAAMVTAMFAGYIFINGSVGWFDAYSARFFMPVLPFLFLPLLKIKTERKHEIVLLLIVLILSTAVNFVGTDQSLPEFMGRNLPGTQNLFGYLLLHYKIVIGYFSFVPLFLIYLIIFIVGRSKRC